MGIEAFRRRCNLKKKKIDTFIGFNKNRTPWTNITTGFSVHTCMYTYTAVEGNIRTIVPVQVLLHDNSWMVKKLTNIISTELSI